MPEGAADRHQVRRASGRHRELRDLGLARGRRGERRARDGQRQGRRQERHSQVHRVPDGHRAHLQGGRDGQGQLGRAAGPGAGGRAPPPRVRTWSSPPPPSPATPPRPPASGAVDIKITKPSPTHSPSPSPTHASPVADTGLGATLPAGLLPTVPGRTDPATLGELPEPRRPRAHPAGSSPTCRRNRRPAPARTPRCCPTPVTCG